ncbi:CBS domain-containing protein [bacterium]|nr:CBS domain-containing protein [bacterium]
MDWLHHLTDPTALVGLLTLIVLEVVLGIDNLVFVAILADKLPPNQRDKGRITGLALALVMRILLLASMSWLVTLTEPFFTYKEFSFSARDLIMLLGGGFLLFKATMELHDRLEGEQSDHHGSGGQRVYASFSAIILQIVILDAVFSIDSVITAIGMVNQLPLMIMAVIIAVGIMMLASKPLTRFVNSHPTVVILCLGFLLMIGFSLVADGFGFHIPKGYLYAAIGFSILIEMLNQVARFNRRRFFAGERPLRDRTADAVLRILGGRVEPAVVGDTIADMVHEDAEQPLFDATERSMIHGVLKLGERSVRSLMTPRHEVAWVDVAENDTLILDEMCKSPYSRLIAVENGDIDNPLGIINKKYVLSAIVGGKKGKALNWKEITREALYLPENVTALDAIEQMRKHKAHMALVVDEYGTFEGLVTATDILEAIAGDMPEADKQEEPLVIPQKDGSYRVDGTTDLPTLETATGFTPEIDGDFHTLAGLVMHLLGEIPSSGATLEHAGYIITVLGMDGSRINELKLAKMQEES